MACVSDRIAVARLKGAFGNSLQLVPLCQDLPKAVAGNGTVFIVVEPVDRAGAAVSPTLAALRHRVTGTGAAVYFDPSRHRHADILRLGAAGVRRIIVRDVDDSPAALRQSARPDHDRTLAFRLARVGLALPESLMSVAIHCVESAGRNVSAEALAATFGVSQRTLTNWARRQGFPGIGVFVSRCRVLHVIGYAGESGGSIESLALRLGFSSAAHLSGMVRRYTGLSMGPALRAREYEAWCRVLLDPRQPV